MRPQQHINPCLKFLLILFILQTLGIIHCHVEANTLALPLKSKVIPGGLKHGPRPGPNKLLFHHNVSLTVSITVGTPPQNVSMVIDTGSGLSWLHCTNRVTHDPFFNPSRSKTFSPVPCSSPTCKTQARDLPEPAACGPNNHCHATLSYIDGSSSEGDLASDTFGFGGSDHPGIVFGCSDASFSSGDPHVNTTGLMGMNLASLSLVSQMKIPKFSYCISGYDSSGILILGGSNSSGHTSLKYTSLIKTTDPLPYYDRLAYTVRLKGIQVNDKLLPIPKDVLVPDHTGSGQTMFDLGTQFTFLLGPAYTALRAEFLKQTQKTLRVLDDPNYVFQSAVDLCYLIPLNQTKLPKLPSVSLIFEGATMRVSGEQLLYRVPGQVRGKDSVHCFAFGNSDILGAEAFIIGNHQQQNLWVEFDLANSRVGLGPAQCDSVGQKILGFDS